MKELFDEFQSDLVRDINLISNEMESNSEVAGQLKEESSIFISL